MTWPRRLLGALLVGAAFLPSYLLLDPERAGLAAAATRATARANAPLAVWGTLLCLGVAAVLALLVPSGPVRRWARRAGDLLLRPSSASWAVGTGTLALAGALAVALFLFEATPTLFDAMAQLLHARALADGLMAAPLTTPEAARLVQNGVVTPLGWASLYPPGHTLLLAAGLAAGAAWVAGPVMLGVTAAAAALAFERLMPERRRTARLAALLVAVSPFMLALGGSYLSHTSAAAFAALALLAALKAREGGLGWAAAAGLSMGAMVATRPWVGLTLGAALTAGVWVAASGAPGRAGRWLAPRLGLWMAGGAPVALGLAVWNNRLFGHPLRFGYDAAFGPSHGLGLHRDPWGNAYGVSEAAGYTGVDLASLGLHLLETPVPALALVGGWLLLARRLPRGTGVLLAWGLVPVAANALYWHHGHHMGPRMLYEAAPAWLALTALAAVGLATIAPGGDGDDGGTATRPRSGGSRRADARDLFLWAALLMLPAALLLQAPSRLRSYRPGPAYFAASRPPRPPGERPVLVFVHGSWSSRVASRLAAAGMRRDSIETALRRNALCRVHLYAEERSAGEPIFKATLPRLDLEPRPGTPPGLRVVEITPGNRMRIEPGAPLHPSCLRQIAADRLGVVELAPLLWQTALPGGEGRVLLVRDLGPATNRRLREAYPAREAWMWVPRGPRSPPVLLPWDRAEAVLWGEGEGPVGPVISRR